MITLVIYGVVAIALAASAGYAFLTFTSSSRQLTQLQENQVRMDTAVAALRASLMALSNNGVSYAPIGTTGVAPNPYMQLPATLSVVGASPWGQPYLYCPVSQTGASNSVYTSPTGSTVPSPSGATYAVGTVPVTITQGNNANYVVTSVNPNNISTANAPGYVAFLVSTLGPGQTMPDCSQITINPGGPTVPGGSVRGVTAGFSFLQRATASSDRLELYIANYNSSTGDGSGRDVNNLATFDNAVATWKSLNPRLGILYLEGGVDTNVDLNSEGGRIATGTPFAASDADGENNSLIIETDPTVIQNGGAAFPLTLNSPVTLHTATTFLNVNMENTGTIYAYKGLTLRNVTFTNGNLIYVYNSPLIVSDSSLSTVYLYASNATVSFLNYASVATNTTNFVGGLTANGSTVTFEGGVPGSTASYQIGYGGSGANAITLSGSTLVIGGMAIQNGGVSTNSVSVTTTGEVVSVASKIDINSGSTLIVNNSQDSSGTPRPAVYATGSDIMLGPSVQGLVGAALTVSSHNAEGVEMYGSKFFVDLGAKYTYSGSGTLAGAIGASSSTISGFGLISIPTTQFACVDILRYFDLWPVSNPAGVPNIPIYMDSFYNSGNTDGGVIYPTWLDVSFTGYPLMLSNYTAPNTSALSINSVNQTQKTQPQTILLDLTTTLGNDPIILAGTNQVSVTGPTGVINPNTTYNDPASFEYGVRTLLNTQGIPGDVQIYLPLANSGVAGCWNRG